MDTATIAESGLERTWRRNLPHWEVSGAAYFITFRLAGSLPTSVAEEWHRERELLKQQLGPQSAVSSELRQRVRLLNERYDSHLDRAGAGPTFLAVPAVAEMVQRSLLFFDGARYALPAYVIMPNHVHLVIRPAQRDAGHAWGLDDLMHSLKSFTAKEANKLLGRTGEFWQREYYDHLIRAEEEWSAYLAYTFGNPVAANLCREPADWPWSNAGACYEPRSSGVPPESGREGGNCPPEAAGPGIRHPGPPT